MLFSTTTRNATVEVARVVIMAEFSTNSFRQLEKVV